MDAMNPQPVERAVLAGPAGGGPDAGHASTREYSLMAETYASRGGLLTGEQALAWMRTRAPAPISALARPIAQRELVSFTWRGQLLVPAFQFDLRDVRPKAGVGRIVAELRDAFDDWDIATWFASRNAWLGGVRPVDAADRNELAVLGAARADRYVRVG